MAVFILKCATTFIFSKLALNFGSIYRLSENCGLEIKFQVVSSMHLEITRIGIVNIKITFFSLICSDIS